MTAPSAADSVLAGTAALLPVPSSERLTGRDAWPDASQQWYSGPPGKAGGRPNPLEAATSGEYVAIRLDGRTPLSLPCSPGKSSDVAV